MSEDNVRISTFWPELRGEIARGRTGATYAQAQRDAWEAETARHATRAHNTKGKKSEWESFLSDERRLSKFAAKIKAVISVVPTGTKLSDEMAALEAHYNQGVQIDETISAQFYKAAEELFRSYQSKVYWAALGDNLIKNSKRVALATTVIGSGLALKLNPDLGVGTAAMSLMWLAFGAMNGRKLPLVNLPKRNFTFHNDLHIRSRFNDMISSFLKDGEGLQIAVSEDRVLRKYLVKELLHQPRVETALILAMARREDEDLRVVHLDPETKKEPETASGVFKNSVEKTAAECPRRGLLQTLVRAPKAAKFAA